MPTGGESIPDVAQEQPGLVRTHHGADYASSDLTHLRIILFQSPPKLARKRRHARGPANRNEPTPAVKSCETPDAPSIIDQLFSSLVNPRGIVHLSACVLLTP